MIPGQIHNTKVPHNLQMGPIRQRVCPWQAFQVTLELIGPICKLQRKVSVGAVLTTLYIPLNLQISPIR
jgi:hypothetical protein